MELTNQRINHTIEYHKFLSKYGMSLNKDNADRYFDYNRIRTIARYIPYLFVRKARGKLSSYGMKHFVEEHLSKELNGYVSNGELILTMLCIDYEPCDVIGPNAYFRVEYAFPNPIGNASRTQLLNYIKFKDFSANDTTTNNEVSSVRSETETADPET